MTGCDLLLSLCGGLLGAVFVLLILFGTVSVWDRFGNRK